MSQKNLAKRKVWEEKIKDWKASGLSAQKWCLENGENYHTFKYWRQTLKKPKLQPLFEELKEEEPNLDIELCYGELKILFPNGCTASLLKECLESIRKTQCSQ